VKLKLILLCIMIVILLCLLACSSAPKQVSVDASGAGEQVEIAVGGSLTVTLESNPTTGFQWELTEVTDQNVLEYVTQKFEGP